MDKLCSFSVELRRSDAHSGTENVGRSRSIAEAIRWEMRACDFIHLGENVGLVWHVILFEEPNPTGSRPIYGTGILFEEPNPTGSRPSDLIGLYTQQRKPHPTQHTQRRARRKHGGDRGHPEEAERRKKDPKLDQTAQR